MPQSTAAHEAEAAAWFYQHSSDGFAVARRGRLISVSPAWCAIMGMTAEQAIGLHAIKLVHPEDQALYLNPVARLEAEGVASFEHRLRNGDGRTIWARAAVKQGQDGLIMMVLRDITAEHQARIETELAAKSTELLRASAGIYLWTFDPDTGRYTVETATRRDADGVIYGTENVSVTKMGDNIHPEDREGFGAVFMPSLTTGEACNHAYRYKAVDADGNEVWQRFRTAWRGVRQCDNGKWEIRGLTQDVTEMWEAREAALRGEQAAREAAETKARFLANMSHEIRTPLNGVVGVLHLLKSEPLSPSGRALIDEAMACGDMLGQLLNDVLDFSKIEAGKLDLHLEPLDPAAALHGVVEMLRPGAEAKGLYLRTPVRSDPGWVVADPVRLRQILFNLIGNAAKFTLHGGVEVRLATAGEGADQCLRIEVEDTGVGVAPEAIDGLFERFHQVDGTTTRRFGGTGLGLAITRSLVEQMGGEVGAVSEPGKGSTFWFEIPAPAAQAEHGREETAGDPFVGLRVLVVEDNPTNRLIAGRILETLGAEVQTAHDGAEGVETAARNRFDLIFMDIQMPGMDGVEATRRIRALGGDAAATPIVAMTANVMKHQVQGYIAAGMDGAVAKPLNPASLVAEVARLMAPTTKAASAAA